MATNSPSDLSRYSAAYQVAHAMGRAYERFIARRFFAERGYRAELIEGFAAQLEHGDTSVGLEIKLDRRLHETGNLCIEVAEKSDARRLEYYPSGIYRRDGSTWYGIGNYCEFFVFWKKDLMAVYARGTLQPYQTPTSRGFLLPRPAAYTLAQRLVEWPGNTPLGSITDAPQAEED